LPFPQYTLPKAILSFCSSYRTIFKISLKISSVISFIRYYLFYYIYASMSTLSTKYAFHFVLTILILSGCNKTQTSLLPVSYIKPDLDSCRNEPDHHYFISKPENISAQQRLPLILVIDPHGDGKLASEKFSDALVDIPAVIAGSEKLRNNYQHFESSLSHLVDDVLAKYPADPDKVIMAGFSGGARMAYYYGMSHKVLGIIMFGAGPDRSHTKTGSERVFAVSGTRDFNFMEQYIPPFSGLHDDPDYMCDFFRGNHEWPPLQNIYESVAYILKDEPDLPESISTRISEKMLMDYDCLLESNDLFFAGKALEKAWCFSADIKVKTRVSQMIDEFKNMPGWIDYNQKFEGYLQKELRLKQAYADRLADPDTSWWKNEILSLNQNLSSCSDPVKEDYLYRLKGFIGIILYSKINAILQNDLHTDELVRLLFIYELAEPESPDLIKFKSQVKDLPSNFVQEQ
jgi:dienelactone hydrolase